MNSRKGNTCTQQLDSPSYCSNCNFFVICPFAKFTFLHCITCNDLPSGECLCWHSFWNPVIIHIYMLNLISVVFYVNGDILLHQRWQHACVCYVSISFVCIGLPFAIWSSLRSSQSLDVPPFCHSVALLNLLCMHLTWWAGVWSLSLFGC